jgi:hypothetical protein
VVWTSSPGFYDGKADIQAIVVLQNGSIGMIATVNDPVSQVSQSDAGCAISDQGIIHAVWIDNRRPRSAGSSLMQKDVYYTRSTDSGEEGKAPVIDEVEVSPEVGKVGESFTFTARYSDIEGDAPVDGAPLLHIYFKSGGSKPYDYPGSPYLMHKNLIPPPDMDYRNGERYIYTLTIEKGLDIYYNISAKAESGNQAEVWTPLLHLPMIDITAPTFTKVAPLDKVWSASNFVEFAVNITDLQSGVDPSSIGFRTYRNSQGGWMSWQSRGQVTTDGNGTFTFRGSVVFDDGDENRIVFRAKDMVGNGGKDYPYAMSVEYDVWVDTDGPVVTIDSPLSGSILGSPLIDIEARVVDQESGVDVDTLEVSYKLEGSSTYSTWFNLSQFEDTEVIQIKDGYYVSFDIPLTYGTFNFVRIRSRDVMGNQGGSGEVQLVIRKDRPVIVDQPPSAVSSVQPRVTGSMYPHVTWATSIDPEGLPVSYQFRILMAGSSEPFLDWIEIPAGTTYWDPSEGMDFTAGTDYTIEIIPIANKLEGPITRSVMTISLDANRPPGKVQDMVPKATGEIRPVLRWTPSTDPEGSEVYYFLRIWKESTGAVLVPWTTVVNGNAFRVPVDLTMGVYTVNILCSDGIDFSPMSAFLLSLGVFSPVLTPERYSIVVYLGTSVSINLTVENEGYLYDTISLVLSGQALGDQALELILGKSSVPLVAGGVQNVTLSVRVADFAEVGFRSLNITARSGDGVTSYSKALSIRVVDPTKIPRDPGTPNETDGKGDSSLLIYAIVIVLIFLIAGMALAFILMERRQREEQVDVVRDHLPPDRQAKLRSREGKKNLPPRR